MSNTYQGTLAEFNVLAEVTAHAALFACCGSERWVAAMLQRRPFASMDHLASAAAAEWDALPQGDKLQVFASHPAIGAKSNSQDQQHRTWSEKEQSGMQSASDRVKDELQSKNADYFAKHGFVFLICATGLSAEAMLLALNQRLPRSTTDEIRTAAGEQSKIIRLRLSKMLLS